MTKKEPQFEKKKFADNREIYDLKYRSKYYKEKKQISLVLDQEIYKKFKIENPNLNLQEYLRELLENNLYADKKDNLDKNLNSNSKKNIEDLKALATKYKVIFRGIANNINQIARQCN